jgi:hypothetical protein
MVKPMKFRQPHISNNLDIAQALSNAGSFIVSLAISNDDNFGYLDVKERGGDEDEMRKGFDKLGYVEIISFRHSDSDKLLTFGKE